MCRDRARLTDEDWERLMRSQGWGFAAGDVVDVTDSTATVDSANGAG